MSIWTTAVMADLVPVLTSVFCLSPFFITPTPSSCLAFVSWLLCSGFRRYHGDREVLKDGIICGIASVFLLYGSLQERWKELVPSNAPTKLVVLVLALLVVIPLLWFGTIHDRKLGLETKVSGHCKDKKAHTTSQLDTGVEKIRALIFPCRTTHTRIFPKRHAFNYSYLLYGIPIVPSLSNREHHSGLTSDRTKGKWWLQLRADDYLERGFGQLGFYQKLTKFLRENGIKDSDWSYAYLVSAPRFFGYSFNPVSFWYIYDHSHELAKMILEVNNTFGERRIYLLDGSYPASPAKSLDPKVPHTNKGASTKFTDVWAKDFHVSPFNSRKGFYALKATNPFPSPNYSDARIDNTITLKSSKDSSKIVARVFSTGPPLDPNTLGVLNTIGFTARWWWVGLVTFPRIVKEAFKLYFKRELHIWIKPEVLSPSISRKPTSAEIDISNVFRDYLDYLVCQSPDQWSIDYYTAIPGRQKEVITSVTTPGCEFVPKKLEIRVSTPAFYSRLVHYAHVSKAFDREGLCSDERNRTLWISHPEILSLLVPKGRTQAYEQENSSTKSYLDEMRWALLRKLRCPPAPPAYPMVPLPSTFDMDNTRTLPYSDLDTFVRVRHRSLGSAAGVYRRAVTRIFLAQRFAFGFVEVVDAVDLVLRVLLCYAGVSMLIRWDSDCNSHAGVDDLRYRWMSILQVGGRICACHFYELMKGYR